MEAQFWHDRWQANEIAFHQGQANRMLVAHLASLRLAPGARLFLPLCGKTRDIAWLRTQGFAVAGAELSELAIQQLFDEMGVSPEKSPAGAMTRWHAPGIDIFVGDFFELAPADLGPVDAVFDRAALVALPREMREQYAQKLVTLTGAARQLLVTFEYDQAAMDGPPFSLVPDEVRAHYATTYPAIAEVDRLDVPGNLKGLVPADEVAWLLA
ncbi:MAG: thiopurine S-methyltransferase [Pseudomonadota bacterium]